MPLKRTVSPSTGIYQTLTVSGGPDGESLIEVFEMIAAKGGVMDDLARIEDAAKAILTEYIPESKWRGLWPMDRLENAPPQVQDARYVLMRVFAVREAISKVAAERIAYNALRLGMAYGRLGVRPLERFVDAGIKSAEGGRKGAERAKPWRMKRRAENSQWAKEDKELRIRRPDLSATARSKIIARNHQANPETVRKAVRRLRVQSK